MSLREIELQQSLDRRDIFITELEKKIEILKQALYHIKDHQDIVTRGKPSLSGTWNIADNGLIEAGIEPRTDKDRKAD